jgi:hypothetical protein
VREQAQQRPEETLLLLDPGTAPGDPDFEACRSLPNVVAHGTRSPAEADRLAALADHVLDLSG